MPRRTFSLTVEFGDTLSGSVDIGSKKAVAIEVPAGLVVTQIAFHGCTTSGGTFSALQVAALGEAGTVEELAFQVVAGKRIGFDTDTRNALEGWQFLKIELPDDELADRTFTLITVS